MIRKLKIQLFAVILLSFTTVQAQVKVGLDNWFNNETHATTGLPFHYLWNDSADSGFSRWGDIFVQKGAQLQTLKKPVKNILKAIDIYIIVDPDSINETAAPNYIMPDDAKIIEEWVKKGGVLILLANDSKHCGLSHLNTLSSRFGMVFNNIMLHPVTNNQYEMGAYTGLPDHPLFKDLKKIFMKEVASINLYSNAKAVLEDNSQAVMAECRHGKGFVFAVGDPWLYNEYIDHDRLPIDFENRKAAENLTVYLISKTP
jgi:unsaturated rhamnogalacturonyl hydrolase